MNNSTPMDDKSIMESMLNATKGVCDLYLHGTIESATPDVHKTFDNVLSDSLCMQNDIYTKMSSKGWYPAQQAPQQQVQQTKSQFSPTIQG